MSQSESRGARSKQRLVEAAVDELVQTGELEVASVARRAGVSVGLPYRYFGTRSGLLSAVVEGFHDRLDDEVTMRRFEGDTWQQREHARVAAWVEHLYREPLTSVMFTALTGDAEVAAADTRRLHRAIELGAVNIARGQRDGDLPVGKDPQLLAAGVLGGLRTMTALAVDRQRRPGAGWLTDQMWKFVEGAVS